MKLNTIKRIIKEDFSQKDQELVGKLAIPLNQFIEQMITGLNKNITIDDNIPFEIRDLNITVDTGLPITTAAFKTILAKPKGIIVINVTNLEDDTPLTSAPFVQFSFKQPIVTINKIYGLPDNIKFNLSLLLIS